MLKNVMHLGYCIFNKGYKILMLLATNQFLNRRARKTLPPWTNSFSSKLSGAFMSLFLQDITPSVFRGGCACQEPQLTSTVQSCA